MTEQEEFPFISCLCPTFRRPKLLANILACYLAQDYPPERRELLILDDTGEFAPQSGPGWELCSVSRRFHSLPEKYNALAGLARGDHLAIWEDDDVYFPWHLSAHAQTLARGGFSKPSRVWCLHDGRLAQEHAAGRFHASVAFSRETSQLCGGWPLTLRGDFDLQFLKRLGEASPVADPCETHHPGYVFRWMSTQAYHGQAFMRGPENEDWYARCAQVAAPSLPLPGRLEPIMDPETAALMRVAQKFPPLDPGQSDQFEEYHISLATESP